MGWTFGHSTKKSLIAHLTREQTSRTGDRRWDCVRHCYRGNAYKGVLWAVQTVTDTTTNDILTSFIGCYLLEYDRSQGPGYVWGYKDMEESSGPCYYSCPLAYLEMVPDPQTEHSTPWREKVRAYHAIRNRKLRRLTVYHATKGITLDGHKIDFIQVTSLRPLLGTASTAEGVHWRDVKFKKTHILEEVK